MVTHQICQLLLLGSDLLLYAIDKPLLDKHPDHCAQLVPRQLCQTPLQRTQKYLLLSVGSVQSAPMELPLDYPSLSFFPSSPKKPFPPTIFDLEGLSRDLDPQHHRQQNVCMLPLLFSLLDSIALESTLSLTNPTSLS